MSDRCFYFGCWNEAGHFLYAPGGKSANRVGREEKIVYYGGGVHLDASLAPRKMTGSYSQVVGKGELCWVGMASLQKDRDYISYNSTEYPQGQFLRHKLDNGFSVISWWDRCQGDTRGACNSTLLLEGNHTSAELLDALHHNFPHVLENLKRGGPPPPPKYRRNEFWKPKENQGCIELVEVTVPP